MRDESLAEIFGRALDQIHAGEKPDLSKLLGNEPEAQREIAAILPLLEELAATGLDPTAARATSTRDAPALEPGQQLGDYTIVEKIGAGGMGVVYKARQQSLKRFVALKVLRSPIWSAESLARFEREPMTAARLGHPGIVSVHHRDRVDGCPFFVMDYVDGRSLKDVLDDLARGVIPDEPSDVLGAPGPVAEGEADRPAIVDRLGVAYARWVAEIGAQAADALSYAHERGVVHRDVKPSNLLLDGAGRALLCDFGLARDEQASMSLSASGDILGTPAYMSPEQIGGGDTKLDHRTDVYSLALTLYEALTLEQPYRAESPLAIQTHVLAGRAPRVRTLNPTASLELEAIVTRGMEARADRRYADASELRDDLRRYLAGKEVRAPKLTIARRVWRAARRRPFEIAAGTIAIAVLTVLTAVWIAPALRFRAAKAEIAAQLDRAWSDHRQAEFRSAADTADRALSRQEIAGDTVLKAKARFIRGAANYSLPDGVFVQAEDDLGMAYFHGGDSEWGLRARLVLSRQKLLEGYPKPAEKWLPLVAEQATDDALRAEATLELAKRLIETEDYEEALKKLESVATISDASEGVLDETRALDELVHRDFLLPVLGRLPRGQARGICLLEVDGEPPAEVAVLASDELDVYRFRILTRDELPKGMYGEEIEAWETKFGRPLERCGIIESLGAVGLPLEPPEGENCSWTAIVSGELDGRGAEELVVAFAKNEATGIEHEICCLRFRRADDGRLEIDRGPHLSVSGSVAQRKLIVGKLSNEPHEARETLVLAPMGGDDSLRTYAVGPDGGFIKRRWVLDGADERFRFRSMACTSTISMAIPRTS